MQEPRKETFNLCYTYGTPRGIEKSHHVAHVQSRIRSIHIRPISTYAGFVHHASSSSFMLHRLVEVGGVVWTECAAFEGTTKKFKVDLEIIFRILNPPCDISYVSIV